jgi:hypothetical protein
VFINDTYVFAQGRGSMKTYGEFREVKSYEVMPVVRVSDEEAEQPHTRNVQTPMEVTGKREGEREGKGEGGAAGRDNKAMEGMEPVSVDADGDVGFSKPKTPKGPWKHGDQPGVLPSRPDGSATVRLPRDDDRAKVDGLGTVIKGGPVEVPGVMEGVVDGAVPGGEPRTAHGTVQGAALASQIEVVAGEEQERTGGMVCVQ